MSDQLTFVDITRCLDVLEALLFADPGSRIHVAAWGYAEAAVALSAEAFDRVGSCNHPGEPGCTLKQLGGS